MTPAEGTAGEPPSAIFDTNVFVGAGFNPKSASARLLQRVAEGRLQLVWDASTRAETRRILERIPRLDWEPVAGLFRPEAEWTQPLDLDRVGFVEDAEDRKFAALALASGAPLVSADDHLLSHRDRLNVAPPGVFLRRLDPD